ncbi:F-box protein At3g07870 [Mercurialis annua]|uniref:F-box protein At3g07870 n=1 Tax=Mercurialis annua TaxID=3986 RepID=UPI00215F4398|nr:F-box protein At3g07870 [Mercurialis annua]
MELQANPTKKRRYNLEDDQPPTLMENLPQEIIQDILSRLPISSLVRFKCVCHSWRALAQDPDLINMYFTTNNIKNDPCLILHCDFPIKNHLYFLDFAADNQEKHKVKRIHTPFSPIMPEFDVVGSCNGLLCLADSLYNDSIFIYNPFLMSYIELPKSLNYSDQEIVFGFGFHPKTRKYKVVRIVYYRNSSFRARRLIYPQSEVQILTVGDSEWRSLGKISYQLVRRHSEASVNGRIHWVSRPRRYNPARRLVSFDLEDEQFREVPKPDCGGLSRCNYHLVVLKGCLSAAVYCNYGRLEIWVMKEYNVKESWVKQYCIGSYMPKGLKQNIDRPTKIWKINGAIGRVVRVLGVLKNGEILLEYKNRVIVSYDPNLGKFKDLALQSTPKWFQTVVHVGSLNWIDSPIDSYN